MPTTCTLRLCFGDISCKQVKLDAVGRHQSDMRQISLIGTLHKGSQFESLGDQLLVDRFHFGVKMCDGKRLDHAVLMNADQVHVVAPDAPRHRLGIFAQRLVTDGFPKCAFRLQIVGHD